VRRSLDDEARRIAANITKLVEAVLTSALYPAPDTLRPTQVSDLLLMTLVNPLPFAGLMTIGLYAHIAAHRLSGHARRRFQRRVASSKCLARDRPLQRTRR